MQCHRAGLKELLCWTQAVAAVFLAKDRKGFMTRLSEWCTPLLLLMGPTPPSPALQDLWPLELLKFPLNLTHIPTHTSTHTTINEQMIGSRAAWCEAQGRAIYSHIWSFVSMWVGVTCPYTITNVLLSKSSSITSPRIFETLGSVCFSSPAIMICKFTTCCGSRRTVWSFMLWFIACGKQARLMDWGSW